MNSILEKEVDKVSLINVKPKSKIPYLWKVETPDSEDNLLVRLCSFTESSDAKIPRAGDKELYVYFMSLAPAGNAMMLRNGMGSKPIDSIKVIFEAILGVVRRYKVELLVFKFPEGRMKGTEGVLKKVIEMLAANRSRGLLEVIETKDNVYLKSKGKTTKTAAEVDAFLVNKTYSSVLQQTRLTTKELSLIQNDPEQDQEIEYAEPMAEMKFTRFSTFMKSQ